MRIREVIVVEGRDDEARIKQYVDAQIIITHGYGISTTTMERIQHAADTVGVILFTDPDFVGNQIREKLAKGIKGKVKHAYISRQEGSKEGNIGVENAQRQAILKALEHAKAESEELLVLYTEQDMFKLGLLGVSDAKDRRIRVGKELNIGYGNAKQFLARLNKFQIAPEKVVAIIEKYEEEHE